MCPWSVTIPVPVRLEPTVRKVEGPMYANRTLAALGATLLMATPALTGCGSDDSSAGDEPSATASASQSASASAETPTPSPTESPAGTETSEPPSGTTIDISIQGGKVDPSGERVKAEVGEPVTLNIDAEKAGELHVHSTPEQEIAFPAGRSTKKLTIDQPGIVDVEDHELEQVIVQLQVG
jgi:hypothetical protein